MPPSPPESATPSTDPAGWRVICLCAQWCRICGEYQPLFDAAATSLPDARFAWVDIEDEADAMGEVDIETFPTLLIAQGTRAHFLGPIAPTQAALTRLVAALRAGQGGGAPPEAQALLARLSRQAP